MGPYKRNIPFKPAWFGLEGMLFLQIFTIFTRIHPFGCSRTAQETYNEIIINLPNCFFDKHNVLGAIRCERKSEHAKRNESKTDCREV